MFCLSSFIQSFPCVAFSGSRLSGSAAASSCRLLLPSVASFSGAVGVGCAQGVDSLVRSAFASASVFSVSSYAVSGRVSRASFALRSSALVSWCASQRGLLVAFPLGGCPSGVRASASFGGSGSGTWGREGLPDGVPSASDFSKSVGSSVFRMVSFFSRASQVRSSGEKLTLVNEST